MFFSRDSTQSRQEALSVLRSSAEFVRYAVSVAVQKIQQLEETGHTDGPDGQNTEKTFRFLCDMTRWESLWLTLQVWPGHVNSKVHLTAFFHPVCSCGVTPTSPVWWKMQERRKSGPACHFSVWKGCSGSSRPASSAVQSGWLSSYPTQVS